MMKSVWVIRGSVSVSDRACLPSTSLLNVVWRCVDPPGRFEDTLGIFEGVTCSDRRLLTRDANLQDQNTPWSLPVPLILLLRSPKTTKLCLFTFKCRILQRLKRTLPLACALDLAALENIPSLSFRSVCQPR